MTKQQITMDELLAGETDQQLAAGEVIEASVISEKKNEVWLDLGAHGIGLVPRREIGFSRDLKVGDTVMASVVDPDIDDGYALLSLRKAAKAGARETAATASRPASTPHKSRKRGAA